MVKRKPSLSDISVDMDVGQEVLFVTPNTRAGVFFFDTFIPESTEYFGRWAVIPVLYLQTLTNAFREHGLIVSTEF